jgi:polyphosphate glucokinase
MALPDVLKRPRRKVLVVDVGGTHVKVLATGHRRPRAFRSGPRMTAREMVRSVRRLVADWQHDVVSIGYPGVCINGRPIAEPRNLGPGWVGFDYERAFDRPVRLVNDAALQAIGSYRRGRMLFLGLGTGLGSAMIAEGVVEPMELAHLQYRKGRTYEEYVGLRGLERLGTKRWRRCVADVAERLGEALEVDEIVIGGGNAKRLKRLPERARLGSNRNAFIGGFRLWDEKWAQVDGSPCPRRGAKR